MEPATGRLIDQLHPVTRRCYGAFVRDPDDNDVEAVLHDRTAG